MTNIPSNTGYAGDLPPAEVWALLVADPKAQLVDVRTAAEWAYVGVPDLSATGRQTHLVQWQLYPSGAVDPEFAENASKSLQKAGADPSTKVFFLCRSGARSKAAAIAMTKAGWGQAFNVAGGFEGDLDELRHRGSRSGWKAAGLSWIQA